MPDILDDFKLRAVTAGEIEFYLHGSSERDLFEFWSAVKESCAASAISIFNIEKERGREQHEVSLATCRDPAGTVSGINNLKKIITELADKYAMKADFSAKPFPDDFGSGLHIHVHLENEQGKNQFFKDDNAMSDTLRYALGGLLLWLPDTMPIFAPHEDSYTRFGTANNSPSTVSWGANNRTVAIRLPDSSHGNKRIEHRVAGADADAKKVMQIILAAIHHGLTNHTQPSTQIYGDASLPSYNLPRLPKSLEEAKQRMKHSALPLAKYCILIDH